MSWLSDGLDWLGGQVDSGSSWGSDAGGWFDRNFGGYYQTPGIVGEKGSGDSGSGWDFGKILNAGRKIYNLWDINDARSSSRSDFNEILGKMEADKAAYDAQMREYNERAAASSRAARRKTDEARRKAEAQALKQQQAAYKQMIAMYKPYADAVKAITPRATKNYNQFLDTTALFNQYLAPTVMKGMQQPFQSAYTENVPQAPSSIPVPQGEAISFPSLEEVLKRGG
jgi:hypothetical protein